MHSDSPSNPEEAASIMEKHQDRTGFVLVVEDEAIIRMLLIDDLEESGFKVKEAVTADEALRMLAQGETPGAVVTDVRMPGSIDGIGLARWMREHLPKTPVIITSGYVTGQEATGAHPDAVVLSKPYSPNDVTTLLIDLLKKPANVIQESAKRHVWPAENLRLAVEAAGVALWAWNVDNDQITMDERGFTLWGLPWSETVAFSELSEHIHPADRDRVKAGFEATRAVLGAYETDFRIMLGSGVRWISTRGQGADVGIVGRTMFGIFLDVTGRKQAEEGHELLAGEMSHRVKNLLSIAAGLTSITSRSTTTTTDMARELTQRLTALGRAHDLVRPLPSGQGQAALLGDLLAVLLGPYDDLGAFCGRIRIAVERMGVGEAAATSLALIVHELATNSLKYGALSAEAGTVDVSTSPGESGLSLIWMEQGGPPLDVPPEPTGFGSKLVERSVSQQLGGAIEYDWSRGGLTATLRLDRAKLAL